jgi:hypothetical protein
MWVRGNVNARKEKEGRTDKQTSYSKSETRWYLRQISPRRISRTRVHCTLIFSGRKARNLMNVLAEFC